MKDWKFGETAFLIAMMMVMMEKHLYITDGWI